MEIHVHTFEISKCNKKERKYSWMCPWLDGCSIEQETDKNLPALQYFLYHNFTSSFVRLYNLCAIEVLNYVITYPRWTHKTEVYRAGLGQTKTKGLNQTKIISSYWHLMVKVTLRQINTGILNKTNISIYRLMILSHDISLKCHIHIEKSKQTHKLPLF